MVESTSKQKDGRAIHDIDCNRNPPSIWKGSAFLPFKSAFNTLVLPGLEDMHMLGDGDGTFIPATMLN